MADNEAIGNISTMKGEVTATGPDGAQRSLSDGDEIFANEVIATGEESSVIFEFADGSRKGMPADAEITLNKSVYNPATAEPAADGISTGDAMEDPAPATDSGAAASAGSSEPIGTLTSAAGDVRVEGVDGNERTLEAGDAVYQGESVFTGDNSLAIFEFRDGSRKGMASNAEINLDEGMLQPAEAEVAEAEVPTMEQVEADMAAAPSAAGGEPAEPVGTLTASEGDVKAVSADGSERSLEAGDEVFAGDTLVSGDGSTGIVQFTDGSARGIASNSEMRVEAPAVQVAEADVPTMEQVEADMAAAPSAAGGEPAEPVGTLTASEGDVKAVSADGSERSLESGDEVFAGDTLVSGDGSTGIVQFTDGSARGIASNSEMRVEAPAVQVVEADVPTMEQVEADMAAAPSAAGGEPAEPVGTLTAFEGDVKAVSADGSERSLEAGDEVFAGDTLVSGDGSTGIVQFTDGSARGIASNSEMRVEAPVAQVAEADVPTMEQVEADMAAAPSAAGGEPSAPAEPIGTLTAAEGDIKAVGTDGSERPLAAGDEVFAGDTLVSGNSSTGIVQFSDGSARGIASNSEMRVEAPQAEETQVADGSEGQSLEGAAAEEAAAEEVAVGTGIPVGTVSAASGDVVARGPDGSERKLEAGDEVNADETVISDQNSTAIFNFYDGSSRGLASNSEMTLDGRTLDLAAIRANQPDGAIAQAGSADIPEAAPVQIAGAPAATQAPVVPVGAVATVEAADQDVTALQQAILEGADPSEDAEAAAAGVQGEDGGHDAVFLLRSGQATTPDSGYDTNGISVAGVVNLLEDAIATDGALPGATPALLFHTLIDHVKQILDVVLDLLEDLLESVADLIKDVVSLLDDFLNNPDISELLDGLIDILQNAGNDVIDALQDALVRVIDLVGGGASDHGHVGDGVADNATTLFIAFWAVDSVLEQLEGSGIDVLGVFPPLRDGLGEVGTAVNSAYSQLAAPVKAGIQDGIDQLQEAVLAENGTSVVDSVQGPLVGGVDQAENALDPALGPVKGGVAAFEAATSTGDRVELVGNAVANELYNSEDGSGVVGDLRGARDGDSVEAAEGTVLGETYDVADEGADALDTLLTGEKYEKGQYNNAGGQGVIRDVSGSMTSAMENQDPSQLAGAGSSLAAAGGDLQEAGTEAADIPGAAGNYAQTNIGGVQNIGNALQQATSPSFGGGGGGGTGGSQPAIPGADIPAPPSGGDGPVSGTAPEAGPGKIGDGSLSADGVGELNTGGLNPGALGSQNPGDYGDVPSGSLLGNSSPGVSSSSSSSSSSPSWDVAGVAKGATSNLMGDGGGADAVSLHSIHVAEDHESAVFHLSADELESGEGGFDIDNFHTNTDKLELSDLLGEAGSQLASGEVNGANLSKYLQVEDDGEGGSTLLVSNGTTTTPIHLQGVDLTHDENGDVLSNEAILDSMLAGGSLDIASTGTMVMDTIDPSLFG